MSLASGQSSFTVLFQQGSQIADVFISSQSGVKGFAQQARDALLSILTPGRMIVLGFAAASAAAYGLYALLKTEQPTAEKNLEEHARLLGVVKSAYSNATEAGAKFYAQSREQTVLESTANIERMRNNLRDLTAEMTKASTTPTSLGMPEMGIGPDPAAVAAQGRFKEFAAAISDLQHSIRNGSPEFEAFNKRVADIGTEEPALREAAERLLAISKNATGMAQNLAHAESMLRLIQGTATEADRALLNLAGTINKVNMSRMREQNEIALKGLTAFSPAAKGEIAFLETKMRLQDQVNRQEMTSAEQEEQSAAARRYALASAAVAQSEAARARELSATQSVASAQLEIDMTGKSIGQQAEMRANLQVRQALEQQASQNRAAFDEGEYERLKKINAKLGERTQLAALAAIRNSIKFDRDTAFLSQEDVQIASQLKGLFPDIATALKSPEAAAIKFNDQIKSIKATAEQLAGTFANDFVSGIMKGNSAMVAMPTACRGLAGALANEKKAQDDPPKEVVEPMRKAA